MQLSYKGVCGFPPIESVSYVGLGGQDGSSYGEYAVLPGRNIRFEVTSGEKGGYNTCFSYRDNPPIREFEVLPG